MNYIWDIAIQAKEDGYKKSDLFWESPNSKLSVDKSRIEYIELDYEKVKHHSVFYIGDVTDNYVVMNLDILESALKRGIKGLSIQQTDVTEEVL